MNVTKMDHAMLSFGLMGNLSVPRPRPAIKRRGLFAVLLKAFRPR